MAGIFGGDIFDGLGQATDAPAAAAPASADKSGVSTKSPVSDLPAIATRLLGRIADERGEAPRTLSNTALALLSQRQAFMPTGPTSLPTPMPGTDPYAYQPVQNNMTTYLVVGGLALAAIGAVVFLSSGRKVQANKRRRRRR
jgi:hypothetical protein